MPWKSCVSCIGRTMALILALGVGAFGAVAAAGYGLYRYFRGAGGTPGSPADQDGLDEERRRLVESDKDEPDSENSEDELEVEEKNEDILPKSDGLSHENVTLNSDEEVIPKSDEVVPNSDEEVVPNSDEEVVPNSDEEVIPNSDEVIPNSDEVIPNSDRDRAESHDTNLLDLQKEDTTEEEIKEQTSLTEKDNVNDSGPLPEDRGTFIVTPVRPIEVRPAPKVSPLPPVAPKPKARKPADSTGLTYSDSSPGQPMRSPNAVLVMPPGLAEKIAQRTPKGQESLKMNGYHGDQDTPSSEQKKPKFTPSSVGAVRVMPLGESPISRRHQVNGGRNHEEVKVNGTSGAVEESEGVSFDEPTQPPKLAFPSRNKGPPRRPPTTHKTPPPQQV